ncbi:hypothetical protein PQQ72_15950 [Paraburkholderia strydomiana]|uniref:hypothetical protein n=1 Tax=Paraburkholderia strydomiana TaxID=1245417 RepID=UPI0038BD462E
MRAVLHFSRKVQYLPHAPSCPLFCAQEIVRSDVISRAGTVADPTFVRCTLESVAQNISAPLNPAAAVVLCLLANAEEDGGMHEIQMKLGLRFAFDREDTNRVVAAGIEKAIEVRLAESFEKAEDGTMYRLTDAGREMMIAHLGSVFKDG